MRKCFVMGIQMAALLGAWGCESDQKVLNAWNSTVDDESCTLAEGNGDFRKMEAISQFMQADRISASIVHLQYRSDGTKSLFDKNQLVQNQIYGTMDLPEGMKNDILRTISQRSTYSDDGCEFLLVPVIYTFFCNGDIIGYIYPNTTGGGFSYKLSNGSDYGEMFLSYKGMQYFQELAATLESMYPRGL